MAPSLRELVDCLLSSVFLVLFFNILAYGLVLGFTNVNMDVRIWRTSFFVFFVAFMDLIESYRLLNDTGDLLDSAGRFASSCKHNSVDSLETRSFMVCLCFVFLFFFQDDMNLSEEKKEPLRLQPNIRKKEMLSMHMKGTVQVRG